MMYKRMKRLRYVEGEQAWHSVIVIVHMTKGAVIACIIYILMRRRSLLFTSIPSIVTLHM